MYKPVLHIAFLFLAVAFLLPKSVLAAADFKTSYNTSYVADEAGKVRVTQNVAIENLTSQYYVPKYTYTIGSDKIQNVSAWDPTGAITPQVTRKSGETKIVLSFKAKVVGKGNTLRFGIAYDFPGLASKNGMVWEMNLIKISGLDSIASYNLAISVPQSYGPALFHSPAPTSLTTSGGRTIITYNKPKLLTGTPRVAFGKFQLYKLSLTYHLKNPSVGLGYTEISIPPDIAGIQQVIQTSLLPFPKSIRIDGDGNYLARYNLGPLEAKDIVWEGYVALFYPKRSFGNAKAGSIPPELAERFTKPNTYWELDAVEIQAESAKLVNPALSVVQNLKSIYSFTTSSLSYNYSKLETGQLTRLGALQTLAEPDQAVCMEYTDLFVALARAAGIPARVINGYAYTADDTNRPLSLKIREGDVLHAWPQAYIPQFGWVMTDPTWGSTSKSNYFDDFDVSHITFAIKGEDSEYPLPAGSYKTSAGQKDVEVAFSTDAAVIEEKPQLEVKINFSRFAVSPFPTTVKIAVKNTGKTTSFDSTLRLQTAILTPENSEIELGTIAPLAEVEREVKLASKSFASSGLETLTATVYSQNFAGEGITVSQTAAKKVRPLYLPLSLGEVLAMAAAAALVFFGRKFLLTRLIM